MNSGIYQIKNIVNEKVYIGCAANLQKRKTQHFTGLIKNKHFNRYLQFAYNKYGHAAFEFTVLEYCGPEELAKREQFHIDNNCAWEKHRGYNMAPVAKSCLGIKRSSSTRKKQAEANKKGVENRLADKKIHTFVHSILGMEKMTQIEFYQKYKLNRGGVSGLVIGNLKSLKGWRLNEARHINSRKLSDADMENMKKDYTSGMNIKQVAKKYSVSRNTAYERLKDTGFKNRSLSDAFKLKNRHRIDKAEFINKYSSGMSIPKLALFYTISATSVRNMIKDYGLGFRSAWETRRMNSNKQLDMFELKAAS